MQGKLTNDRTKTMRHKILNILLKGVRLSELVFIKEYDGGTSFRTRISELKREDGIHIESEYEHRNGKRYKVYWMTPEEIDRVKRSMQCTTR